MSVKSWKQNSTVGSTWEVVERKCSLITESRKLGDDKSKFAGRNWTTGHTQIHNK
jgi:hypothetical protein